MSNIIKKLTVARENFERVQTSLTKYGAGDTEPDWVFQDQIRRAVQGEPYKPLTAGEWQLYTCSMKCDGAAKRLNAATEKVVNIISTAPIGELVIVEAWAKQFCWRLDF
jgi:hypothetical protein